MKIASLECAHDKRLRIHAYRIFKHTRNHVKNGCEGKVAHIFVITSAFTNRLLLVVVILLQRASVLLQSLNVKMEEPIVAEYDRQDAGELCDAKSINCDILVVHHQHDEHERSNKDVKCVENDFELDETENLANKCRRFGRQLDDTGENHCVAAKFVSARIAFINR